jgi:hypothetical protein
VKHKYFLMYSKKKEILDLKNIMAQIIDGKLLSKY